MGLLKTRKNKKFGYSPRYYESEEGKNPFEIEHKFDKFRTTVGKNGLKGNFKNAISDLKDAQRTGANRLILIFIFIFLLIFLWIIDFDISIFL